MPGKETRTQNAEYNQQSLFAKSINRKSVRTVRWNKVATKILTKSNNRKSPANWEKSGKTKFNRKMWRCTKLTILEKNTLEKRPRGEGQEISGNTSENTEATMENIPALKTKRVWLKKPAWLGRNELQVCREPSAPGDHPAPRHTLCREREREVTQRKLNWRSGP